MAHLVKPWVVKWVDPKTGRRVKKGTPGAVKQKEQTRKWYAQGIPGQGKKRFPLYTDERESQKKMLQMVERAERGRPIEGDDDSDLNPDLGPLVEEFRAAVSRKSKDKHTAAVIDNVRKVLDGCKLKTVGDLHVKGLAAKVEAFVASLVSKDVGRPLRPTSGSTPGVSPAGSGGSGRS